MEIVPYSFSSGRDLELELPPFDVKRQDSLYRDATMPAHAAHHGQVLYTLQAFQHIGLDARMADWQLILPRCSLLHHTNKLASIYHTRSRT